MSNYGYLSHHGVKGQKWGVRRYQNSDGSLTAEGQRRYGSMSGDKLYKTLKKQVRDQRVNWQKSIDPKVDWSVKWGGSPYGRQIGENSKKLYDEENKNRKLYENSKEYKEWDKEGKKLENQPYDDKWDKKWKEHMDKMPKKNFKEYGGAYSIGLQKYYVKGFLEGAGKDMTIAKLKDLGYNDKVAKEFTEKLIKSKYTLGDI